MKKIIYIFLMAVLYILNFGFAISSGDVLRQIKEVKSYFLSTTGYFNQLQKNVISYINGCMNKIYSGEDVDILLNLGKLQKVDLKQQFLDDLIKAKSNFVIDITSEENKLNTLEEKRKYGLITGTDYYTQLSAIKFEISTLSGKYSTILKDLKNLYINKLKQLSGEVNQTVLNNQGLLDVIKNRLKKLKNVYSNYDEYKSLYSKITTLFLGARGDYINFLNNFEIRYQQVLNQVFDQVIDNYCKQHNLYCLYGSGIIYKYKENLIDALVNNVERFFNKLLDIGVDKNTLERIDDIINLLRKKYGEYPHYNRNVLLEDDYIDKIYNKFLNTLNVVIDKFNQKLAEYNFPTKEEDVSKILREKLQSFIKDDINEGINELKQYLQSIEPYIKEKIEKAQKVYEDIWNKYYKCEILTGYSEKIKCLTEVQDEIISSKKIIKEKNKLKLLNELYWSIEVEKIDLQIKEDNLDYFDLKYKDIDKTLNDILNQFYQKFKAKGELDKFKEKLKKGIKKIDEILNSGASLSEETKYLLLKIKKAFIKFLYLK